MLGLGAWAQTITLTFTGRDAANHHAPLSKVIVTNITQNWQETLYGPDTVLHLTNGVGVDDFETKRFQLSQNTPNPFTGTTDVQLEVSENEPISVEITDMGGRKVLFLNISDVQAGAYTFRVQLASPQTYLLTARQAKNVASIKMVNNGSAGTDAIRLLDFAAGHPVVGAKSDEKGNVTHPWAYGDNLIIKGYSTICGTEYSKQLSCELLYSETIALDFDGQFTPPTVSNATATNITGNSVTLSATAGGNCGVTSRGFCYGTTQNPTLSGQHTTNGSGTGNFSANITGLTPLTTYYVRSYATNSTGTTYSNQTTIHTQMAPPTITTGNVTNISATSADCQGNVTDNGGGMLTVGICYSTSPSPTIASEHTSQSQFNTTGSFTHTMTDLSPATTYYVRAYATNNAGTGYGNQRPFTTPASTPTVVTAAISDISAFSATCGGNVSSDGGATVTARGVCWSTSQNPTISDSHTTDGGGTGSFISNITGLTPGTTYYVRAYATNSVGTAYGDHSSFMTVASTCPTSLTDYDGNTYSTVLIGSQCWMAENLRTTHYSDGTYISLGSTTSNTTAYRCYPGNSSSNVSTYGYLYNWKAVTRISDNGLISEGSTLNPSELQGVCPAGWHVPSNAEWTQLSDYVSSQSTYVCGSNNTNIAKALASTTGWNNSTATCAVGNTTANNNATGFNAMPAGFFGSATSGIGSVARFWSTTDLGSDIYIRELWANSADLGIDQYNSSYFHSVRCLKDEDNSATFCPTVTTDYDGNNYNTVHIGTRCWMAENLRTTHYSDGTPISLGNFSLGNYDTSSTVAYRYYPNNNSSNVPTYGYLYNWKAVIRNSSSSSTNPSGVQGICPTGWHVPSAAEWTQLIHYLSSQSAYVCGSNNTNIAKALASTTGWSSSTNTCAVGNTPSENNATGFNALPAGKNWLGDNNGFGNCTYIWSATRRSVDQQWMVFDFLSNGSGANVMNQSPMLVGASVRCIHNGNSAVTFPTITTTGATSITDTTAVVGGLVSDDGGSAVTARGVCWSTSPNPMLGGVNYTIDGSGTGGFTSTLTNLAHSTTYYVRAYATNNAGAATAYGDQVSFTTSSLVYFTCGTSTISDYDGNTYNSVQIGNQCWMKQNLRTTHYADGTPIPAGGSNTSSTDPYYYDYSSSGIALSSRGYLYNWPAVMNGASSSSANPSGVQGICPTGWHVPSDAEWTQLTDYVSSQSAYVCNSTNTYIAKALASTTGWITSTNTCAAGNNPTANNATGFSAVPTGNSVGSGFNWSGYSTTFWSSTQNYSSYAWYRSLGYSNATMTGDNTNKNYGFSVRCLRD